MTGVSRHAARVDDDGADGVGDTAGHERRSEQVGVADTVQQLVLAGHAGRRRLDNHVDVGGDAAHPWHEVSECR